MTTLHQNKRKFVAEDINANLQHIARVLQNDANKIVELIEAIETWSAKDPEAQYDGEIGARIGDLLSITNNSNYVSYLEHAIRIAYQKASA
jgi:hypothetical protein